MAFAPWRFPRDLKRWFLIHAWHLIDGSIGSLSRSVAMLLTAGVTPQILYRHGQILRPRRINAHRLTGGRMDELQTLHMQRGGADERTLGAVRFQPILGFQRRQQQFASAVSGVANDGKTRVL